MGLFCTDESQEAIIALISSWCDWKGFRIVGEVVQCLEGKTTITTIEAHPGSRKAISAVRWYISSSEGKSIVRVRMKPSIKLSVFALLLMCACACVAFYTFFSLSDISNAGFLSLMLFTVLLGLLFLFTGKWLERKQIVCEDSFWETLPKKELLRHVEGHYGPIWFELSFPFVVSVFLFLLFAVNKALVFGAFLLSFFWCFALVGLLDVFIKDSYSRWKMLTAHVTNRWIHVCFRAIFPLALPCAFNSLFVLGAENPNVFKNRAGVAVQKIVGTAFSEKAFSRTSVAFEEENSRIFKSAVKRLVEAARGKEVNSDIVERKARGISAVVLAGFVILLVFYFVSLRRLFNAANEWGRMTGYEGEPKRLSAPPVHLKQGKTHGALLLALVTHYLLGSVITVATGIISFDAICYVLSKQSLIIRPMGVLYAWVFTFGSLTLTPALGQIVGSCLLLVIAFPFVVFLTNNVKRMVSFLVLRIMLYRHIGVVSEALINEDKVKEVQGFIRTTCEKFGLTIPRLVIEEKSRCPIFIRGNLMSKTSTLGINQNVLENLSSDEIEAAVAHELGHLAQGLKKTEWLKLLSVITMYSNYYLTLCLDMLQRELEADRFALRAGVSSDNLVKAMVKVSLVDLRHRPSLWKQIKSKILRSMESISKTSSLNMVNEFFFGEAILGYTYPVLSERLAAVMAFAKDEVAPEVIGNKSFERL